MKVCVSQSIKAFIDWEQIKASYKATVADLASKVTAFAIDRDGDLFQIACPTCRTKKVNHADGSVFICARRHVFSVYTEDGVREITDENKEKVLGDDLQKNGKDAHDHHEYMILKPNEKTPIYISYWFEDAGEVTPQMISDVVWKLREKSEIVNGMSFDFMAEIETMFGGKPVATIGSRIKTWPTYTNNMKWFMLMMQLKDDRGWGVRFLAQER